VIGLSFLFYRHAVRRRLSDTSSRSR
jgi:hypothetical protein